MTGVSFIVTVFDKVAYLPRVVDSLARQQGDFAREFVFVDDGSTDGSAELIARLTQGWADPVLILKQPNRGASAATNAGCARATLPWLKLLDGDDLLADGATALLLRAATETGQEFSYGDLGIYPLDTPPPNPPPQAGEGSDTPSPAIAGESWGGSVAPLSLPFAVEPDGLAKFIRNCPANSSSMLIAAERYRRAGGCDERLVSPDQALFLRLFATGGGTHVEGDVALVPDKAPGRLSGQTRRSRYESVLALYYLLTETPGLDPRHAELAYRRGLSRAVRFHRAQGGFPLSRHLWALVGSRLRKGADPTRLYQSLAAFTEDGSTERPASWLPGALRH